MEPALDWVNRLPLLPLPSDSANSLWRYTGKGNGGNINRIGEIG